MEISGTINCITPVRQQSTHRYSTRRRATSRFEYPELVHMLSPFRNIVASSLLLIAIVVLAAVPARAEDKIDRKLVERGKAEADILWRKGFTLGDVQLDQEVQETLDRLVVNAEIHPAITLKVLVFRSPELNAFAMPDGSIYVFVGLLATLNSMDELAFVLGHEARHSIGWHAQKNIAQYKQKRAFFETLSIATTIALGTSSFSGAGLIDAFSQMGLSLVAAASITGYGRDLEREADVAGFEFMRSAGYEECGTMGALEAMLREHEDPNAVANFFWGSHPLVHERIETIEEQLQAECEIDTSFVAENYSHIKWPMVKLRARLWNAAGERYKALESANEYVTVFPDDAEIHCLMGHAYRNIANADTLQLAAKSYWHSLELADSDYREPLLGLSLIAEARGDTSATIQYLERYLSAGKRVVKRRALSRKLNALKEAFRWSERAPSDTTKLYRPDEDSEED